MALAEGQVRLRDLVMGPGTSVRFRKGSHFNPFVRVNRADGSGKRAWRDGAWSGIELTDEAVVPMRLVTLGPDAAGFAALHQQVAAAFAPSNIDLPLTFAVGGVEYVMFGRPRLVEPDSRAIGGGHCYYQAAFVALDPRIYSAAEHSAALALPLVTGGLTLPVTAPLSLTATVEGNTARIVNAGTAPAGLRLRIDGPVAEPRVSLVDGAVTTINLTLTLTAGQWLDIDTLNRTVYLNGTASRRAQAWGGWPILPGGGGADVSFSAGSYDASAALTVFWRDSWY